MTINHYKNYLISLILISQFIFGFAYSQEQSQIIATPLSVEGSSPHLSYDGKYLTTVSSYATDKKNNLGRPKKFKELNLYTLSPVKKHFTAPLGLEYWLKSVSIDRNNELIALGNQKGYVDVFNLNDGSFRFQLIPSKRKVETFTLTKHGLKPQNRRKYDAIQSVMFSPTADLLVTANIRGKIQVWNSKDGKLVKKIKGGLTGQQNGLFSPDGKYFALSSKLAKKVKVWSIESGKVVDELKAKDPVKRLTFSANSKKLMIITTRQALFHDINNKPALNMLSYTFTGDDDAVVMRSFSIIDNDNLVTSYNDGLIQLWAPQSHKVKQKFQLELDSFELFGTKMQSEVMYSLYSKAHKQLIVKPMKGKMKLVDISSWLDNSKAE